MDAYEAIISDLKIRTNGKELITPEQLSHVLPISAKQQSHLRKNNAFPIKHVNLGSKVFYSVHLVANFLAYGEEQETQSTPIVKQEVKTRPARTRKTKDSSTVDMSHLFNLRAFASNVQSEIQRLQTLHDFLLNIDHVTTMKQDMQNKLSKKEGKSICTSNGKI
ncbi:hypothetical protein [Burkholderia gladioli]|uniref:hypothetical protein n=1 Tax=Burkholderia gladioli TaxID=28095 RepID=UPI001640E160|nr:hypothetical protein [Burkholderia gladioli]